MIVTSRRNVRMTPGSKVTRRAMGGATGGGPVGRFWETWNPGPGPGATPAWAGSLRGGSPRPSRQRSIPLWTARRILRDCRPAGRRSAVMGRPSAQDGGDEAPAHLAEPQLGNDLRGVHGGPAGDPDRAG